MRTRQPDRTWRSKRLRDGRSRGLTEAKWIGLRGCLPYGGLQSWTAAREDGGTWEPVLVRLPRGGRILAGGSMRSPPT